eukprot:753856-Hanusia_phi.AAC.1
MLDHSLPLIARHEVALSLPQCPIALREIAGHAIFFSSDALVLISDDSHPSSSYCILQILAVPMRIREDGREERRSVVCVSVSIQQDSQSTSTRQLMSFQLTDEADSFFLYTLKISEEEFQNVKSDQSILVDFAEFPNKSEILSSRAFI